MRAKALTFKPGAAIGTCPGAQPCAVGIFNVGTGRSRSFLDLASSVYRALGKEPQIKFRDTPVEIRDKYQYFTEADMSKLKGIGYEAPFHTLEEGVGDYVRNYLIPHRHL